MDICSLIVENVDYDGQTSIDFEYFATIWSIYQSH